MSVDQEQVVARAKLPNIKYRKSNNLTTLDNEAKPSKLKP